MSASMRRMADAPVMIAETAGAKEKKKHSPLRRVISAAISLVIVAAIFIYAIPRIADYSAVWATIRG